MKWMDRLIEKWYRFVDFVSPFNRGFSRVFRAIRRTFRNLWKYIFWFRSVILGAPLAVAAVVLAAQNMARLPDEVPYTKLLFYSEHKQKFLPFLFTSEAESVLFGFLAMIPDTISKAQAVFMPLTMTAVCIVLMILSKRMLYPFLIGLLTLVLPFVIYWFIEFPK